MFMLLKLLLQTLVLPPARPLLLLIAGACLARAYGRGARRVGWTRLISGFPNEVQASTDALHEILGDLARRALVLGVRRHTP